MPKATVPAGTIIAGILRKDPEPRETQEMGGRPDGVLARLVCERVRERARVGVGVLVWHHARDPSTTSRGQFGLPDRSLPLFCGHRGIRSPRDPVGHGPRPSSRLVDTWHPALRSRVLTRKETFFNILCKEPKLDTCLPTASPQFLDLVSRLLCKQPSDRLGSSGGAHEIKSHPFFHGVNWDSHHEIPNPPYTPSPHMLVLDSLQDNDTLLESQLTIAEHRRRMAHASANNLVHTHHHDFRVF